MCEDLVNSNIRHLIPILLSIFLWGACTSDRDPSAVSGKKETAKKRSKDECQRDSQCPESMFCWKDKCVQDSAGGGPCNTKQNCDDFDLFCWEHKCIPRSDEGGPCRENGDCSSNKLYCQAGKCASAPVAGKKCAPEDLCAFPFECEAGTCVRVPVPEEICDLVAKQCRENVRASRDSSLQSCFKEMFNQTHASDYDTSGCLRQHGVTDVEPRPTEDKGSSDVSPPKPSERTTVRVLLFPPESGGDWDALSGPDPLGTIYLNGVSHGISKHQDTDSFELTIDGPLLPNATVKVILKESDMSEDVLVGEGEATASGQDSVWLIAGTAVVQVLSSEAAKKSSFFAFKTEAKTRYESLRNEAKAQKELEVLNEAHSACKKGDLDKCTRLAKDIAPTSDKAKEVKEMALALHKYSIQESIRKRGRWIDFESVRMKVRKGKALKKFTNKRQTHLLDKKIVVPEDSDHMFVVVDCEQVNSSNEQVDGTKDEGLEDGPKFKLVDTSGETYDEDKELFAYYYREPDLRWYQVNTGRSFKFSLFFSVPKSTDRKSLLLELSGPGKDGDPLLVRVPIF